VTFEDALAALMSFVGRRVDVAVESPAGGLVAHFSGALAQGHELTPREADAAPLFFSFDDGASGFILAADTYAGAERSGDGALLRIEDRAGVAILVELTTSPADS
jgi:hypothetical protein